jgi:predicted alternative tryptophan synthase beta-subunit
MYTLGRSFVLPSIHTGGLRYHGDSPLVSQLYHEGLIEAVAAPQRATFEAGLAFARAKGVIPAPENQPRHPRRNRRGYRLQAHR